VLDLRGPPSSLIFFPLIETPAVGLLMTIHALMPADLGVHDGCVIASVLGMKSVAFCTGAYKADY